MRLYQRGKKFYTARQYDSAIFSLNSAITLLKFSEDSLLYTNTISRLGLSYLGIEKFEKAQIYLSKALQYEIKIGDSLRIAKGYNNLGIVKYYKSQFDSAIYYYTKAYEIYDETAVERIPQLLKNIGIIYRKIPDYSKASHNLFQAAKAFNSLGNYSEEASIYNSIGNMFHDAGYDSLALYYHDLSWKVRKTFKNKTFEARSLNNIGNIIKKTSPDSALSIYQRALSLINGNRNQKLYGILLNNIGEIYLDKNQAKTSVEYFKNSLKIKNSLLDEYGIAVTIRNLSEAQIRLGNYSGVENIINQGFLIAKKLNAKELLLDYYALQAYYLSNVTKYKEAKDFYEKYIALKDSMINSLNIEKFSEIEIKYRTSQLQKEIEILKPLEKEIEIEKLRNEQHKTELFFQRALSLGMGLISLLALGLVFFIWRSNNQRKKINSLLELRNSEITHRIQNNLAALISIFSGQSRLTDDTNVKKILLENENRIKVIGHLHKRLSLESAHKLSTKIYIEGLLDDIVFTFNFPKNRCSFFIDSIDLEVNTVLYLGMVINELVTNSIKHALIEVTHPLLEVSLRQHRDSVILINRDNGPGLPLEFDFSHQNVRESYGITLIHKLVERQLKGKINYDYQNGSMFKITIPL